MAIATQTTSASKYAKYFNVPKIARKLRCELGRKISQFGEKIGHHRLIYNPLIFAHFHYVATQSAPQTMKLIGKTFPNAKRYLDVGAGTGAYAHQAMKQGKTVVAIEHSPEARRVALAQKVDVRKFDLMKPVPAIVEPPYDLAYCFEVAEHLPPFMGDMLVKYIASMAPIVIWTAAQPPWRGGIGHINEQHRPYWIERFEKLGMTYRDDLSVKLSKGFTESVKEAWWLAENVCVFERA